MQSRVSLLQRITSRFGFVPKAEADASVLRAADAARASARVEGYRLAMHESRGFLAAMTSNDAASWSSADATQHINVDTAQGLATVRARSRDAARNNEFARYFLGLVDTNVLGPFGVQMQSRVTQGDGALKKSVNDKLEAGWRRWGKRGNCDVTRRYSWRDIEKLTLKHLARDGEALIRLVVGRGPHRFQVQLLDPALLDVSLRMDLPNGNRIRMGVELGTENQVVAYHLLADNTTDDFGGIYTRKHTRVPADELLHIMLPDEINQLRGLPWMHAALKRMWMTHDFSQAGLNAARESAKRRGWITSADGAPPPGATQDDGDGQAYQAVQDGQFDTLPQGYGFTPFESKYPNIEYGQFVKDCLRTVATGLGVSYISLGNDLSEVNYSSARVGILLEREIWRGLQQWFIDAVHQPIYDQWLRYALLADAQLQSLDYARLDVYRDNVRWQPRVWSGIDPLKDIEAEGRALELQITSPQRVIAARGEDPEEIIAELRQWNQMTTGLRPVAGVGPSTANTAATSSAAPASAADSADGTDAADAAAAAAGRASASARRMALIVNQG